MSDLTIDLAPSTSPRTAEERAALLQDPGFGQVFTDHMVTVALLAGGRLARRAPDGVPAAHPRPGDLRPALRPGDLRGAQGLPPARRSVALFRPEQNARRFQRSARRLAMAELPERAVPRRRRAPWSTPDRDWVPSEAGRGALPAAVHVRDRRRSSGVRPPTTTCSSLIASPAGAYFPGGVRPVSVWLSTEYVRAAPGGTGEAKCAGQLRRPRWWPRRRRAEQGCDQVVWLDAVEHR